MNLEEVLEVGVLFEEDIALLPPPLAADFIIELLNN
jgi:hypothetical protein